MLTRELDQVFLRFPGAELWVEIPGSCWLPLLCYTVKTVS